MSRPHVAVDPWIGLKGSSGAADTLLVGNTPAPEKTRLRRTVQTVVVLAMLAASLTVVITGQVLGDSGVGSVALAIHTVPLPIVTALVAALIVAGMPSTALTAALGLAYGPLSGGGSALAAITVAGIVNWLIVRQLLQGRARERLLGLVPAGALASDRSQCIALTAIRLVGTPLIAVAVIAATMRTSLAATAGAIALGSLPRTFAWAFAGSSLLAGGMVASIALAVAPLVVLCVLWRRSTAAARCNVAT